MKFGTTNQEIRAGLSTLWFVRSHSFVLLFTVSVWQAMIGLRIDSTCIEYVALSLYILPILTGLDSED